MEHLFLGCNWVKSVWFGSIFQWHVDAEEGYDFKSWVAAKIALIT